MAHVVTMVLDGLGGFVRTLWGLQERPFSTTFNAVIARGLQRFPEETDNDGNGPRGPEEVYIYDEQDPSKPLPEGYVMAYSLVYSGHLGGTTWNEGPPVIAVRVVCFICNKHGTHALA
ncbi:hypothetical protein M0R45_004683 [Rubus argutus]|uniref:Uncharacterized protein n=1 Tax=Rubus argutus TaxID=59490 RepID=A0AAW1YKG7_RUBAR